MKCTVCGEILTKKEEAEIREAKNISSFPTEVRQICDFCFKEEQEERRVEAWQDFSDAFSGQ